jgi:hypothetical protein
MSSATQTRRNPAGASTGKRNGNCTRTVAQGRIQLYGWDARCESWHGPNELSPSHSGSQRIFDALKNAPGKSWYGPVNCSTWGESSRFFTIVHDLGDCALATVYCDESKTGPAEIVVVIPAWRRSGLRPEFAFEFLAFATFLGSVNPSAGLEVHERLGAALAETEPSDSLVFSISAGLWPGDIEGALSQCVEKVVTATLRWMGEP